MNPRKRLQRHINNFLHPTTPISIRADIRNGFSFETTAYQIKSWLDALDNYDRIRATLPLAWSTDIPDKIGWYLAYECGDPIDSSIFLVCVTEDGLRSHIALHGGNMSITHDHFANIEEFSNFSHWMGPIPFPADDNEGVK